MTIFTFKVPIIKTSTNQIYAGTHWTKRKKLKEDFMTLMKMAFKRRKGKAPKFTEPVSICFNFYFRMRPLDCSNCSYMAKMIEDILVKEGILIDDTPKYVQEITLSSQKSGDGDDYAIVTVSDNITRFTNGLKK